MVRPKRSSENHEVKHSSDSSKRYKDAIDSSADELVCPLTLELPLEPVMAEDGKVYEQTAIESYFSQKGLDLKSPVTNEPMGRRLLPALQMRNLIEKLVQSGAIGGDKAVRWKEELDNRKRVAALRKKAEDGDTDAMHNLAIAYNNGHGIKQDSSLAYTWYKKAADGGHIAGTAAVGWHYIQGRGVDKNSHLAMLFLGRAEKAGSNVAAFVLGQWFCKGSYGLPRDPVEGKKLLTNVVRGTCKVKHLQEQNLELASKLLRELDVPAVIAPEPS